MTLFFPAFLNSFGELCCKFINFNIISFFFDEFFTLFSFLLSLTFTAIASYRYWIFFDEYVVIDEYANSVNLSQNNNSTIVFCHFEDVILVRTYLIGVNAIVALNFPILFALIYHSARGSISDVKARQPVAPLLYFK
jgi:hypothetical protein